jgi:UDP-N-acetylmuramoyl-L-alanyl-D-glutamate--2,6-diaminopimelate ligase
VTGPGALHADAARHWPLAELLAGFAVQPFDSGIRVDGLTIDSRSASPGMLFLACRGRGTHGLKHAEEAVERGCVAIAAEPDADWGEAELVRLGGLLAVPVIPVANLGKRAAEIAARFFGDPAARLTVFAVTGSTGKTCVAHFLAQALAAEGAPGPLRCAVISSLGSGFFDGSGAARPAITDAVAFHGELARLVELGADAVAVEASSIALDQRRIGGIRPGYALFTNLTADHLDYHGDMASYTAAKRRLFRQPGLRWAVLNDDDPASAEMESALKGDIRIARYGMGSTPPKGPCAVRVWGREVVSHVDGLDIRVETDAAQGRLRVGVVGRFQAANLLAVLAVLLSRGEPLESALSRMRSLRGLPGRMEPFGGGEKPLVVVDDAHVPAALEQALLEARAHCRGRVHVVFGCGGGRDPGKRPAMGALAERLADVVVIADDNPRMEDGERIAAQILSGMARPDAAIVERQRALAIRGALTRAGRDDVVLVAGKGDETLQDMGELKVRYSDRAQVVQALGEWEGRV